MFTYNIYAYVRALVRSLHTPNGICRVACCNWHRFCIWSNLLLNIEISVMLGYGVCRCVCVPTSLIGST